MSWRCYWNGSASTSIDHLDVGSSGLLPETGEDTELAHVGASDRKSDNDAPRYRQAQPGKWTEKGVRPPRSPH
jgi:hypothetical protein